MKKVESLTIIVLNGHNGWKAIEPNSGVCRRTKNIERFICFNNEIIYDSNRKKASIHFPRSKGECANQVIKINATTYKKIK